MADSSLAKKLLIKPGQRMVVINPPPGYLDELGPLPEGVGLADRPEGSFDFVHLFVKDSQELKGLAPVALGAVKRDGLLWISYPKQSSKVKTDITRDTSWEPVRREGFELVSMVSVDEVWSACRFRPTDLVGKKRP